MTEREAVDMLEEITKGAEDDPESAHSQADGVLLDFLREAGFGFIVEAWEKVQPKWYA